MTPPSAREENTDSIRNRRVRVSGAFADLYREFDWSRTPLGTPDSWPDSLIATVNTILAAPIPMQLFWGADGICLYNEAMCPHLSTKHPASLGQPASEVWKEAWEVIGPQIEAVFTTGCAYSYADVFLPLMREGRMVDQFWSYSYSPVFDAAGNVAGVLDVAQETTEKVLAVTALEFERARLDAIIENVPVGVLVADKNGKVLMGNGELDRILRHPLQQSESVAHYGERFALHPDGTRLEAHEYPLAKALTSGKVVRREELRYLRGDGTIAWIGVSASPIRTEAGEIAGGVIAVSDIDSEKRHQEILQRSEDRFRELVERAGIGINIGDAEGNLTYINPALLKLIGYTKEEVARGDVRWSDLTPPEYEAADLEALRQLQTFGVAEPYEKIYCAKDGRRIPVLLSAAMIPSMSGDDSQEDIAVFFTNLSYQKRAEAVLLQTEKLAAVGRLASTIAHEINNPLEAVTNLLYLARQNAVDPDTQGWLDQADAELRRMAAIAKQTLRFHRQATAPQAVSCTSLFTSTLDLYEARIRNSSISVEKRKRANEPVLCFEGDIRQVLSNVVTNALDAMPLGGRLLVRSREGTDWRTGRKGLLLTVADTGTGMNNETRERVFEAFYTTKGIGGTGLGLWISADIIARHQGRLLMRSNDRDGCHGTTVSIFLPFQ